MQTKQYKIALEPYVTDRIISSSVIITRHAIASFNFSLVVLFDCYVGYDVDTLD